MSEVLPLMAPLPDEDDAAEQSTRSRSGRLPTRLSTWGGHLLHAQCWAWGQDIKQPDGNLLLAYGFERIRPPAGLAGCSQYTVHQDGFTMRLWGFGVYAGREQGMYLNRYEFVPRRATLTDTWTPALLRRSPRNLEGRWLFRFLDWVCGYEEWVEGRMGRAYREAVLGNFGERFPGPLDLAVEWLRLKEAIKASGLVAEGEGEAP